MPRPTADDVQLILRLYELRRDPEMRRARAFMLSEFNPKSWDEVRPHYLTGDEVDRHFRMATSYWEMVAAFVNRDPDRRRPGQSAVTTQRKEPDKVEILSGVFEGVTTGATIALVVRSVDARPGDYSNLKDIFRPGHADYTYWVKYGVRDYRGSGRSSGRETVGRVAAGAIARIILSGIGARVQAYTVQVGDIVAEKRDLDFAEENPVRCPDREKAPLMEKAILAAREAGDSLGGVVEIRAEDVPAGLGDPVMGKLEAVLACGLLSIGAVP